MPVAATRAAAVVALALASLAGLAVSAAGRSPGSSGVTTTTDPNVAVPVPSLDQPPPGRRLTGEQVQRTASRVAKVRRERAAHPGSYPNVYTKGPGRWQVSFFTRDKPPREIAQVYVDDRTGRVTEAWTGPQVAWTMARGYAGAFGRKVNDPWVWIPLSVLFVVPFVDLRRPRPRMVHLDLLAIAAFGVSVAFFNDARIDVSVPIVYPLLLYLLARMLWVGLRPWPRPRAPLRTLVPVRWLGVALVFLIGFRVALNVVDSNVIDVGYSGVIGADRLADGEDLWGNFPQDNKHGDTYGPVTYAAYVP
jgi:hypothetical protein